MFIHSTLILFVTSTVLLFLYLNRIQPHYFIDEAFHIPQTLRYCAWNFTEWDPKITTLPGLYLITTAILSPFNLCNIIYIRCVNLIGTCINLYLIYNIIKENCKSNKMDRWSNWLILVSAYNITLFPPLYFWCFFYYTDVASVNTVLLMLLLHQRKHMKMSAFAGLIAVVIRQTNIIWLSFLAVEHVLDLFDYKMEQPVPPRSLNTPMHFHLIWKRMIYEFRKGLLSFIKFLLQICGSLLPYITICLMFIAFVVWNKGIVIGDRSAHVATIHVCQIFYFSAFVSLFSWPYAVLHWRTSLRFLRQHWILMSSVVALITVVIRFNTLVHPYVLADNRHYWFYVWNRLIGRYTACRYLLVPVYCASLFAMSRNISHLRFLTQINYMICVCMVLIPQLLVEPRYFILPYIFYRLNIERPRKWQICLESLTTLAVNLAQFFIFANKVFYWEDQPYAQRISW
ncbi:putative Dol-P-Glc:Glc(2)Man(9)GlcNAc(2)-PP-Dol alpha-1,2-glucosyltransferase [Harpegnathos saltator]|uniref:Dol-P-Glc:Glc(2)Man(9)GlcNAc(2)-PP-Dol alpha-1,2-glucosyltransferase n=1 Tax=Harpegnathos saltator TaxID=610380 RepID=E2C163_HARSA|nr:putative Dol-P-Glc:Glc(2)Man(9)GlcNAc(2)-PP-Dol alpha-1,2-glucosyltransferase [Harpegnathos saltator]EFN78313.1 Putative alpha-1,2-glucosyltransferase ALG10-B [Harpegnathos saltator]